MDEVEELLNQLAHGDAAARTEAADQLGELAQDDAIPAALVDKACEVLATALGADPKPPVRVAAARALGYFRHNGLAAMGALLGAARHREEDEAVREECLTAIGYIALYRGDDAEIAPMLAPVRELLKSDSSPAVRGRAADTLGQIRDAASIPLLVGHLRNEPDWTARRQCAQALGQIGEGAAGAIPDLVQSMGDGELPVAHAAVQALGHIRHDSAVKALLETLRDRRELMPELAVTALTQIVEDHPAAAGLVKEAFAREKDGAAAARLLDTLAHTGTFFGREADLQFVREVARSHADPKLRKAAQACLAELAGESVLPSHALGAVDD